MHPKILFHHHRHSLGVEREILSPQKLMAKIATIVIDVLISILLCASHDMVYNPEITIYDQFNVSLRYVTARQNYRKHK